MKINTYKDYNIGITRVDLDKILTDLRHNNPVLSEIHSQVCQMVTKRLDNTYQRFFKSKFGYPKFRSSKVFFNITYPQNGYKILNDKNIFKTKIYGDIKVVLHREVLDNIKQVTITRNNINEWYLCVTVENIVSDITISNDRMIGIDLGISKFVTRSDGKSTVGLNFVKYYNKCISKLQSIRSKCKKYSRRYDYLSNLIRKLYGVKNRKTNDFLHKVSRFLSKNYDIVVVEDLDIVNMVRKNKNHSLNNSIYNMCWNRFITFLEYKCKRIIKVNPYNTSKKCHNCGTIHDIDLSIRTMNCSCGISIDRDYNAAINIYCAGRTMINNI
jgi:putative transposase